jgi:hypothetical protein
MNNFKIQINGHSMSPFINDRESVIFSPDKSFSIGDILLFKDNTGEYVAHRVIQTSPLITKGDIPFSHELIESSTIFGKAVSIIRENSEISLIGKGPWMMALSYLSRLRKENSIISKLAKLLIHGITITFQLIYSRPTKNHI